MKNMKKALQLFLVILIFSATIVSITFASSLSEKDKNARNQYKNAHETYLNEVEKYKTARLNFLSSKARFQKTKNKANKKEYEGKAQQFLGKSVSVSIKYLAAVRNKAENVRGISETDRASILAEIDVDISWLKAEEDKLSGLLSAEETRAEAIVVRDYWKNVKLTFKKSIAQIWVARTSFVIDKSEDFSTRVSGAISQLESEGQDTAELNLLLDELNSNIKTAREKIENAKSESTDFEATNLNQKMKKVHGLVKDVNEYIKKAHKNLVDITKKMKEQSKNEKTTTSQLVE